MKSLLAFFVGLTLTTSAFAKDITTVVTSVAAQAALAGVETQGLNLKVGDNAKYNVNVSFIKGTMDMTVDSIGADGVWIHQNLDLSFAGKQNIQILIDPNTGQIKKMIVNGKEQAPPTANDIEIVDTKEDTITVPAGTFLCVYIKAHDRANNQDAEQWVNMKQVAVFGLVKSIAASQLGPVTIELTSFKKM